MPGHTQRSPTHPVSRIVLTGFMGAGKTTSGRALAARLDWQFLDVDEFLCSTHQTTIAALFSTHQESGFRQLEAEAIRTLLDRNGLVLALGGGAIETAATRELLASAPATLVVFLDAPLEIMLTRCAAQPDAAVRPLLQDRNGLETRLANRLPYYRQAHLTIATAGLSPDAVAQRIEEALGNAALRAARQNEEKNV